MSWALVRAVALSNHPLLRRQSRTREFLAWVADFADEKGEAFPSLTTIAERMGLPVTKRGAESDGIRDLRRVRRALIDAGLLRLTGKVRRRVPVVEIVAEALTLSPGSSPPGIPGVKSPGFEEFTQGSSHQGVEGSSPPGIPGVKSPPDPGVKSPPRSSQDPTIDPTKDPSLPLPPQGATQGEGEFFARVQRTAAAVVDRYLDDEERPFDEVMGKGARAKLEQLVVARLQGPTDKAGLRARGQDILRAWELLRDDPWWSSQPEASRRACLRLGWLCGNGERIEQRFDLAGERPQWTEDEDDDDEPGAVLVAPDHDDDGAAVAGEAQ